MVSLHEERFNKHKNKNTNKRRLTDPTKSRVLTTVWNGIKLNKEMNCLKIESMDLSKYISFNEVFLQKRKALEFFYKKANK